MKKSIKHLSKSTLAVVLSLCMLISCAAVGIVATDAAKVTEQQAVSASVDNGAATGAALDGETAKAADAASDSDTAENLGASDDGAVGAAVDSDSAVSANLGSTTDYGVAGDFNSWSTSTRFNSSGTYTVSLTAGTTYEFKITYNGGAEYYGANTTFSATQSEYYFNKAWDNAKVKASVTGDYVFTFKRVDQGDGAVNVAIKFPTAATYYPISKGSTANGDFRLSTASATAGTTIYVYTTPNRGYQVNTVTATGVSTVNNLGNNTYSFTMPSQAVTVNVTFKTAASYTLTAQVTSGTGTVTLTLSAVAGGAAYAAVTTSGTTQSSITAYDGETLTISTSAGSGYQLNTLTRSGTNVSSGSTWTVSGAAAVLATFTKQSYSNWYTATPGSTTSGMYTKVKATFFDYYTNGEFNNGWYSGIQNSERGEGQATCTPYTQVNYALSNYARSNSVTYPLYFGNFYNWNDIPNDNQNPAGYHFYNKVNNSNKLDDNHNSVTGLTGKKLSANGLPTHYSATGTNENGVEMKQFDKNWLSSSSQNGYGKLASIVDSPFPVKSTNVSYGSGSHTYYSFNSESDNLWFSNLRGNYDNKTAYLDMSATTGTCTWYAYLWNSSNTTQNTWVQAVSSGTDQYAFTNPDTSTYNKVIFLRTNGTTGWDNNIYNKTADLDWPSGADNKLLYKTTGFVSGKGGKDEVSINGGWQVYSGAVANQSSPTVEYSTNASDAVYCPNYGRRGFFPFDHSHAGTSDTNNRAWDLGFGVALEIKFTLGPNGKTSDGAPQIFEYSGDDDLWVFVDDNLILDLGGDHFKSTGKIDFSTGTVTATKTQKAPNSSATRNTNFSIDYSKPHTMKIFYMERGMFDSNLMFGFSMYPYDDTYEVENIVDAADVNPGLKSIFTTDETFTFTNTSGDGKGKGLAYTQYKTSTGTKLGTGTTNATTGNFTLKDDQYDEFTKKFTVGQNLKTVETISSPFTYDTSYTVVDVQNNNKVIKAGNGTDTGNFNYLTTKENADPELDITHIRTTFVNTVQTTSFMLTKDLIDYDDTSIEFPYTLVMYSDDPNNPYNLSGLKYKTSLDGYSEDHTYSGGIGTIHEDEFILFEGIPVGTHVMVYEPTVGDDYTPNIEGKANCFMDYDINHSNDTNTATFTKFPTDSSRNLIANVTLNSFDIITMSDELKTYCADYQLPTRLYGEKLYKLPEGKLTPAMVDAGYASIDNNNHTVSLTQAFVSAHIPYETIFMKSVNWNASNARFELNSHDCNAYAYLAATSGNKKLTVKIDTDGDNIYDTTISDLDCGEPVLKSKDPVEYVSGTKVGDTPSYWQITDTKGNFVTNCYSVDFYYVAYDNYLVKAIYGQGKGKDLYDKFISSDINDLGVTRSHWNDTVSGNDDLNTYTDYGKTKTYTFNLAGTEYDRLYLDMSIAFNAKGKLIKEYSQDKIKVGYEILVLNDNGTIKSTYKDVVIKNTDLDNKNRIHVYYGFKNTEANRALKLGIQSYVILDNGSKHYSDIIMPFELNTEGSK